MERDFAVLFRKELINNMYFTYIFRPCYVIEGMYDKEENIFLDDLNNERLIYNDPSLVETEEEFCVGLIFNEEELMAKYPHARTIEEAKMFLQSDMDEYIVIGMYDVFNDVMINKVIDMKTLSARFINDNLNAIEENNDEEVAELDTSSYENTRDCLGKEFTLITTDDYDELMNINDYEAMKFALNLLKSSTKTNFHIKISKLETKQKVFLVPDSIVDKMLELETLEEIKAHIDNSIDRSAPPEEIEEEINGDDLIESFDAVLDLVMNSNDINEIKNHLIYVRDIYKDSLLHLDDNNKFENSILFFNVNISAIDRILKFDDIDKIKDLYYNLHYESETIVDEMVKELCPEEDEKEKEERIHQEKQKLYDELFKKVQKPGYAFDYKEVHDKMVSRIIGRDMQIDSILTTIMRNDSVKNPSKRSAMIIAGTTGTGKTQTYTELKRALDTIRPVNIVDTNQITSEGYVGGTIEDNVLAPLIMDAHSINQRKRNADNPTITKEDLELARHGIVILDEIDKRAEVDGRGDNVNKSGVVHQLLKLMDPSTKYFVKVGKQAFEFDTSELTIFAGGAFQEYFDEKDNNKPKNALGFGAVIEENKIVNDFEKYNEVDPSELVRYGLDRQFIGRFNRVILFPSHTKESLLELETNKATSNIQVEVEEYKQKGISFVWEDGFIEEAVEKAYDMKTGGRALANIIARSLGRLNVEVNNRQDMFKIIFVPKAALEDSGKIVLVKYDDEIVLLEELYKESAIRNKELKQKNEIERDENSYKKVMDLYKKISSIKEEEETPKVLVR